MHIYKLINNSLFALELTFKVLIYIIKIEKIFLKSIKIAKHVLKQND
jgi:hypothetical protein